MWEEDIDGHIVRSFYLPQQEVQDVTDHGTEGMSSLVQISCLVEYGSLQMHIIGHVVFYLQGRLVLEALHCHRQRLYKAKEAVDIKGNLQADGLSLLLMETYIGRSVLWSILGRHPTEHGLLLRCCGDRLAC